MPKPASTSAVCLLTFTTQEKMTPLGHPGPITEAGSDPPTKIQSISLLRGTTDKESDDTSHATAIPIVTEGDKHIPQVIHPTVDWQ